MQIEPQPFKVDQFWSEVKAKQAANPIMKEDFHAWRNHPVTQRLFDDLEVSVLEAQSEMLHARPGLEPYFPGLIEGITRAFEWAPQECYGEDQ